ncbi:MAG: zinc-ribbon domain-containing protein [Thermodesulfovibrionales bacterium]
MVVICPKCKVKLKVDDAKLSSAGSRFKCPKCSTVLVVKKPAEQIKKYLDSTKVLLAHSNTEVLENARTLLQNQGYKVITSTDGIDVMVKALKELPFLAVVEVSLPKIYGFEICKRLKSRPEMKDMKFILVPSTYDKTKYRREPVSLYGADDYIEAHDIPATLIEKINRLVTMPEEGGGEPQASQKKTVAAPETPKSRSEVPGSKPEAGPEVRQPAVSPEKRPSEGKTDEAIEKACRLSRTIIDDIYLYNPAKVMESIKNDNFFAVFASELKEGQKLYENRIPLEIRDRGNYYRETIEKFIAKKKKELS